MSDRWNVVIAVGALFAASYGDGASHTAIPRFAYVANNQDDTVSIFAIGKSTLRAVGYVYTGPGSDPRSVVVTPSQAFLYVAEGSGGIAGYAIDNVEGGLTAVPGSPFLTGSEFSLVMYPSGKFLIAVTGSALIVYAINSGTGALTLIQTVSDDSPTSAAIDPKGSFLFAANVNSNSVSAFTINQNTGILTPVAGSPFPSGPNPQSVAIQQKGKFLYVPNGNDASISGYAVNSVTGALTQVPGSPFAAGSIPVAAVTKKYFLYVGNSADKTVGQYAINPTTGSLTAIAAPFSTGRSGPLGLTASPDEPLLYVADHDSDEVLVLGITKAGLLFNESSIRTRGNPLSIALASGDAPVAYAPKFVYECNETSGDIWGYRVSTPTGSLGTLEASPFAAGQSPQSVATDLHGGFLFTANSGSNNISAFTINSQTGFLAPFSASPYPAGTNPSAVAVDNSARYVYVANRGSNTITGYAVGSSGALTSVPGSPFPSSGVGPRGMIVDPQDKFIYVANAQSNTVCVFEIDALTGTLQTVSCVEAGTYPVSLTISPDGKYLYALNQSSENISAYGVDPVTGELAELPGSPFAGSISSISVTVDPSGNQLYAGAVASVFGYRLFDTKGNLRVLSQSPFDGVSDARGLSFDLGNSFLYSANNADNTLSGFSVDKATGDLSPLSDSPYVAGTNPTSLTVVNNFQ
jgi:6-phosphogluconolactonase